MSPRRASAASRASVPAAIPAAAAADLGCHDCIDGMPEHASARELGAPQVWGAEPETAAPFARSFELQSPQAFKEWQPAFVDGAGGMSVLPRMWERVRTIVSGSIVVTLEETRRALRMIADQARVVAEGAGTLPLAAALTGRAGPGPIVAIVPEATSISRNSATSFRVSSELGPRPRR